MIKPEMILNRQINYLIIKETWCVLNGPKTQLDLYGELNMSRQLYSRIMTGQCDTQLDAQAKYCSENTGVDIGIFRGKKIISIDGIGYDSWENFFGYMYSDKKSKDYQSFMKKLRYQISLAAQIVQKQGDAILGIDENLRLLILFSKYGSKQDVLNNYTRLNNIIRAMESIDINFLESVFELEQDENKFSTLEKYRLALRNQYELTNSVYIYRKNSK